MASGRKGFYDEVMVKKIVDLSNKTIEETLRGVGEFKNVSVETKIEIASRFALKGMPQKIEGEGFVGNTIVHVIRNERAVAEERQGTSLQSR